MSPASPPADGYSFAFPLVSRATETSHRATPSEFQSNMNLLQSQASTLAAFLQQDPASTSDIHVRHPLHNKNSSRRAFVPTTVSLDSVRSEFLNFSHTDGQHRQLPLSDCGSFHSQNSRSIQRKHRLVPISQLYCERPVGRLYKPSPISTILSTTKLETAQQFGGLIGAVVSIFLLPALYDIAFATRYCIDFMVRRNMRGGRRIESHPPASLATAVWRNCPLGETDAVN